GTHGNGHWASAVVSRRTMPVDSDSDSKVMRQWDESPPAEIAMMPYEGNLTAACPGGSASRRLERDGFSSNCHRAPTLNYRRLRRPAIENIGSGISGIICRPVELDASHR